MLTPTQHARALQLLPRRVVMAYVVMPYRAMAYVVMACVVMAYVVAAYVVVACVVMARALQLVLRSMAMARSAREPIAAGSVLSDSKPPSVGTQKQKCCRAIWPLSNVATK